MLYACTDGHCEIKIEADSAQEAAQEYVDGGDWNSEKTIWVNVHVSDADTGDKIDIVKITVHPREPRCAKGRNHDWSYPHALVGGLVENPGVQGHGGGVLVTAACLHCGCARHTDTWAQDPADGTQGLQAVWYEPGAFADHIRVGEDAA